MAITAGGVGSGLDINGIVTQLMALERRPANLLEAKNRDFQSQLSSFGRLRSSLSTFQSAMEGLGSLDKFKVYSAVSTDEDVLTASTTSEAAKGTYDIDISRLAQRHKMASDQQADTAVFSGDLTITVGSDSLTINPAANTLEQMRDLINNDTNNPGVTASIINVDAGLQRLVLTSEDEGYDSRLQLSGSVATTLNLSSINQVPVVGGGGPGPGGGDPEITYETITDLADLNAAFTVDGFDITASSNQASGVIDGITFELKSLGSSTLTIDRDADKIEKSAQAFVKAYNSLVSTVSSLSQGDLSGDSSLRSIETQVRNVFNTSTAGLNGTFNALVQVGVKTDSKTGELSLDTEAFAEALDADFQSVADLFANDDQGFAFRLAGIAESLLSDDNVIDAREEGIKARVDYNETSIESWENRLALKETALRSKFAALDTLVGSLQSTSSFLAQQLSQ